MLYIYTCLLRPWAVLPPYPHTPVHHPRCALCPSTVPTVVSVPTVPTPPPYPPYPSTVPRTQPTVPTDRTALAHAFKKHMFSYRIIGPCALEGSCAWAEMGSLQWAMYILFGTDTVILKRQMAYVVCFKLPAKIPSHKWHLRTFCFVRPFKVRVFGSCKNR